MAQERPTDSNDVSPPALTGLDGGLRDDDRVRLTRAEADALRRGASLTHAKLEEHLSCLLPQDPGVDDPQVRGEHDDAEPSLGAQQRAASAEQRDIAATERDLAAEARDRAMAQHDAAAQHTDDARRSASERVVRAAGAQKRATARRAQAAQYRALAANDRRLAAQDRDRAAVERSHALVERQALAGELAREQQRRDEAQRRQHDAEGLARTLRRSLCPPRLPQVAGFDVAVHCAQEQVGCSFYDLFELTATRSGFFTGHADGSVPDAVGAASVARYALRTAAGRCDEPAAVLRELNASLMRSAGTTQTCSAAYGAIHAHEGAADVTLAAAGRTAALIMRADGTVEAAPAHGTPLGAVADPVFETCHARLVAGDALVVHTDTIIVLRWTGGRRA